MKKYKNFYLYNELVQEIQKLLSNNNIKNNNTNKEEIIFNNLNNEYLKKIKQKENKYPKDFLDNEETAQVKFKEEEKIKYPDSFEIINKYIYEKIKIRKDDTIFNFGKKEYLINECKIFLKLDYPTLNIYEINIGTIDKNNDTFVSNYLFKYKEQNGMYVHYYYLIKKTFTMFRQNNISKKFKSKLIEKTSIYDEKEIGRIYVNKIHEKQNSNNPEQHIPKDKNKNIRKEPEKELTLNQQIINNIKFLSGFYLFYEDIKNQAKKLDSSYKEYEKGYMINEKLFKLYSKNYDYNKFKDILNNDNKIKLSIDRNKNLSNDENIEKISNELIKILPNNLKEKYINGFNEFIELLKDNELYSAKLKRYNHKEFLFFNSCILVKENLIRLISTDSPEIQKIINNLKVHFLITDKKLIINYNYILYVGYIDKNYIFNPELIFFCSGNESLEQILKDIRIYGYNNVLNKIKIKEKNVATYNYNNSILVLLINENLISTENYLDNSTKNMILALFDSEKIKKKINLPLNSKNNKFNRYYFIKFRLVFILYKLL